MHEDPTIEPYIRLHRDESLRTTGRDLGSEMHGYREWFRLDGTIMRSGHVDAGRRVGERVSHDTAGRPRRTTHLSSD